MRFFTRTTLALTLCSCAMAASAASGFSGSISFDKPEYLVDEMVTMSLSGFGLCKNFTANWGDGTTTTIISYYFDTDGPLHLKHAYKSAGPFYPIISETKDSTSPEQCGSRSASIKILATGKVTDVTVSSTKVQPGESFTVTVNGSGKCEAQMAVVYNTQPLNSQLFDANAPWPRVAKFTMSTEGDYYFNVYNHAGGGYAQSGSCWSPTQPKVVVKKTALNLAPVTLTPIQIGPNGGGTPPAAKPAGGTTKKPCRILGKPGVGEDCNVN